MNNFRNVILVATVAAGLSACGGDGDGRLMGGETDETETFRQALPSAADVEMSYSADGNANGIAGDLSLIAIMTAQAVIGTNAHMIHHFAIMHAVSHLRPTEEAENFRAWQGEHEDLTVRVEATRAETPRGYRYDYSVSGKVTDSGDDFLPVVTGHVVRLADEYEPRDGFGIVRFHFTNLNTLQPEREIGGTVRVAFRKANRAHQVHVRAIGVTTPDDPYFPPAAEYMYAVAPDTSGALRWFSRSDVKRDSEPLENVAVHSVWRKDKSGIGSAVAFGGSIEVDFWHLAECWGSNFTKGYEMLEVPQLRTESGEFASCFATPEDLEVPSYDETLPDEDPAIPAPMDEETDG